MPEERDYKVEVERMMLAINFLAELDLDFLTETVKRTNAIGPFLDPTQYRDRLYDGSLDIVEKIASGLKEPVAEFVKYRERHGLATA